MHDNHEPTCSFCIKFILPFDEESPLADWGYCKEDMKGKNPTEEEFKEIEEEVKRADYRFLTGGRISLYQALGEGCDRFEDVDDHH